MLAFLLRVTAAAVVSALAACSDEQPSAPKSQAPTEQNAANNAQNLDDWLELTEGTSATEWLAARSAAKGNTLSTTERADLETALATAASRLGESPRMIANRSVQLENMLRDIGHEQAAIVLIRELTSAIGETGQTEGFGAISQHYYIMRKSGLTADQAVDDLKRRYGPRG